MSGTHGPTQTPAPQSHFPADGEVPPTGRATGGRPTLAEWAILALAAVSSLFVLAAIAWRVRVDGLIWSGSVSGLLEDTMQYVTWTHDASQHLLVGNDYTLAAASRSYLHPGLVVSGLLHRAGLSAPLAYAVWVPVASVLVCWGAFAFVAECMERSWQRVATLALALFFMFPTSLVVGYLPDAQRWVFETIAREPGTLSPLWGYPYSALAVGLSCLSLVAYIRNRRVGKPFSAWLAASVVLTGWLQPWEGATMIATLVLVELLLQSRRFCDLAPSNRRSWSLVASASAAGLLPLVYYALLGRFDSTFIESERNLMEAAGAESWWLILLAVAPLALPALLVLRIPVAGVAGLTARAWPLIAIGQAMALGGFEIASSPSHALRGVAIPLSVLAVTGASNLLRGRRPSTRIAVAIAGLALFAVFGTASALREQERTVFGTGIEFKSAHYFVRNDDLNAYQWLASSPVKGGVLGDHNDLASMVPWRTGRKVWAGHLSWTPKSRGRFAAVELVMKGAPCCRPELIFMNNGRFVQATGARFILVGCWIPVDANMLRQLGTAVAGVRRFGCVTVIEIRSGTSEADKAAVDRIYGASPVS